MTNWSDAATLLERLATAHNIHYAPGLPPAPRLFRTPDRLALNYVDWGGSGEPMLLLHGGTLTCHTFDLVCLALRDSFHCVALDLRGHGNSGWADDTTMDAYVSDAAAVIADFGWSRVHMVGMSLGGIVAAHYAATGCESKPPISCVDGDG